MDTQKKGEISNLKFLSQWHVNHEVWNLLCWPTPHSLIALRSKQFFLT